MAHKYRTLHTKAVATEGTPVVDLKSRQTRLIDLAAEGWTLQTTVAIGADLIDTLSLTVAE